jgi:hypothetical protein
MMKYFLIALFGFSMAYATPPKDDLNNNNLETILAKIKNNDPLSREEKIAFDQAVQDVNEKIKKAGGKKTTLTTIESRVNNQRQINEIRPTISDLLEKGKQYPWGLDLELVEKRGFAIRSGQLGGEDVTSYISTFQKAKTNPNDPKYHAALNKIIRVTKLSEDKIKSLPDWEAWTQIKSNKEWVSQCQCLIKLLEPHFGALPAKKGIFTKGSLMRPEAYDRVNDMKIKANQAVAIVNKEMKKLMGNHANTFEEALQAVRIMETDCLKNFAYLSDAFKKASKGRTVLDSNKCQINRGNKTPSN